MWKSPEIRGRTTGRVPLLITALLLRSYDQIYARIDGTLDGQRIYPTFNFARLESVRLLLFMVLADWRLRVIAWNSLQTLRQSSIPFEGSSDASFMTEYWACEA